MTGSVSASDDPLVIDTKRLHRQPGSSLRLDLDIEIAEPLGNDVLAVPARSHAFVDLLLESVLDGILVTGVTEVPAVGICVRCLDGIAPGQRINFRQFFSYPGSDVSTAVDESEDVVEMAGSLIDLGPAFRDAVLLALPLTPTCRPDCPGLCPVCGQRMAEDPAHKHEQRDPRWSALSSWQVDHPQEGD